MLSTSNFSRLGPAITPTIAKRSRDTTPTMAAEGADPRANVANEREDMKLLRLQIDNSGSIQTYSSIVVDSLEIFVFRWPIFFLCDLFFSYQTQ